MSRHIADKDHSAPGSSRVRNYARIEHDEGPSPATKILQTRPETRLESARLQAYLKIERGYRA